MDANKTFSSGENTVGDTWYVDNYVLLKDYYDMTISRIAARCVRKGNIAMEEYEHYQYILDVLEEISETGDYIVMHANLHEYVDRKIPGGINTLKKSLREFKTELQNNASPEMIKQDPNEVKKMKEALGEIDSSDDPTNGAGMSMDDVINKLMRQNNITPNFTEDGEASNIQPQAPRPQAPQPQMQQPQPPRPQAPQPQMQQPQAPRPQAPQPQMQQPQAPRPQVPQPQMQQPQAPRPQAPQPQMQQPQASQPQTPQPQASQPQTPQPQAPQPQTPQIQVPQSNS